MVVKDLLMLVLDLAGGSRVADDIKRALGTRGIEVTKARLQSLVARLRKDGLIRPPYKDGRPGTYHLTPLGEDYAAAVRKVAGLPARPDRVPHAVEIGRR